jgi:hypothetical protein
LEHAFNLSSFSDEEINQMKHAFSSILASEAHAELSVFKNNKDHEFRNDFISWSKDHESIPVWQSVRAHHDRM